MTWRWTWVDIVDGAGDPVDLSSATFVAKVLDDIDGADVVTLTATGGSGTFTLSATSSDTAGTAPDATRSNPRKCVWFCKITSGANVLEWHGPDGSPFSIYPAGV